MFVAGFIDKAETSLSDYSVSRSVAMVRGFYDNIGQYYIYRLSTLLQRMEDGSVSPCSRRQEYL